MEKIKKQFFWADINIAIKKGLTFYQTRSNAIIFQKTRQAYCIPKVVRMKEDWRILIRKKYTCLLDLRQRSH